MLRWWQMNGPCPRPDGSPPVLLLVSVEQFGCHIDTYEYCRSLRDRYRITYLCLDQGLPRRKLEGVEELYCGRRPLGKVELGLLADSSAAVGRLRPDAVFLGRTKFSFLLRLRHPRTPMIFDVRSGSVEAEPRRRAVENLLLRCNSFFFRHITVISEGLRRQLGLPRRARVLPLAANPPPALTAAPRDELRLVYVGTFKNRHLERTVEGLGRFLADGPPRIPVCFTLVGFGSEEELEAIRGAVRRHRLEHVVELRERVAHDELPKLLAQHNVGVAFTPQVPWFEHQPSTKIYEYLHSGLLCLATDTAANRELVSDRNGVLVADTPEAFAQGIGKLFELLPQWRPAAVAESVREHTWERVVTETLAPLLEQVRRRGPVLGS